MWVSNDTLRRGLERVNSSKIHCRAAPMPRVAEDTFDMLSRVPKLTSFVPRARRRSSDTAATR